MRSRSQTGTTRKSMSRQHHPADPERLGTNAIHDHLRHRARQIRRVTVSERFGAHRGPAAFSSARPAAAQQPRQPVAGRLRHAQQPGIATGRVAACNRGLRAPPRCSTEPGRLKYPTDSTHPWMKVGAQISGSSGRTGCNRTGCAGSSCRSTRSRLHGKPFVWPAHPARIIAAVQRGRYGPMMGCGIITLPLLDRHTLREIARLVNIGALQYGDVISE